jgi:hypothetical protein
MTISNLLKPKFFAIAIIIFVLATVAFGYAAANVVPESGAGEGVGTVSGYTIANIDYTLLTGDPTKVASVTFDVTPTSGAQAPEDVLISVDSGTTWITCTGPTTNNWACAFGTGTEPDVSTLTSMQVVAAQ